MVYKTQFVMMYKTEVFRSIFSI